eukprot:1183376-Prorocentrum_minimum.AAC.4
MALLIHLHREVKGALADEVGNRPQLEQHCRSAEPSWLRGLLTVKKLPKFGHQRLTGWLANCVGLRNQQGGARAQFLALALVSALLCRRLSCRVTGGGETGVSTKNIP